MKAHQRPFISWVPIARVVYIVVIWGIKKGQYKGKCVDYHATEQKTTKGRKENIHLAKKTTQQRESDSPITSPPTGRATIADHHLSHRLHIIIRHPPSLSLFRLLLVYPRFLSFKLFFRF
jgi:hypothetical protein